MNDPIKNILLYPNPKTSVPEDDIGLIRTTLSDNGIASFVFRNEKASLPKCDAVIALGGDGTMLSASRLAWTHGLKLLGINFGKLGYMSGLEISEISMLSKLSGDYDTETRMLIDISVKRNGHTILTHTALNEAVAARGSGGGIAQLDLKCDGARVCSYRADGVIVATPTGSSAYAMSAGGPIIDTKLDAFCVCAICPHTMGTRPLVFSPKSKLEVTDNAGSGPLCLTADGLLLTKLEKNDSVEIVRSQSALTLIRLKKDAFYDVLYRKLS